MRRPANRLIEKLGNGFCDTCYEIRHGLEVLVFTMVYVEGNAAVESLDLGPMRGADVARALETENRIPTCVEVRRGSLNSKHETGRIVDRAEFRRSFRLRYRSLAEIEQPQKALDRSSVFLGNRAVEKA